jgi:hypothetical protein
MCELVFNGFDAVISVGIIGLLIGWIRGLQFDILVYMIKLYESMDYK